MIAESSIVVVPRNDQTENTHLTLKRGLRTLFREEPPHVEHHPDGAPYFPEYPGLLYSSSDCNSSVALQVAPAGLIQVGIDVEDKAEQASRILERYTSDLDREMLRHYPDVDPLHIWSGKEAVYKAFSRYVRGFRDDIVFVRPGHFTVPHYGDVRVAYRTGAELTQLSESGHSYPTSLILAYITSDSVEEKLIIL